MLFRVLITLLFFASGTLLADRIVFSNGPPREGKILGVTGDSVKFQEKDVILTLKLSDIVSMEVGFDGVPICLDYKIFGGKECGFLLHKLSKDKVYYVDKKSPLDLKELPLKSINSLSFQREPQEKTLDLTRFLDKGVQAEWKTKDFQGRAEVASVKKGEIELLPEDQKRKKVSVKNNEIQGFEVVAKKSVAKEVIQTTPKLIPGYAPVERKQYGKGIAIFSLAALAGGGMVYEYNEAVNAINNDQELIPLPDGRIVVASNLISNDNYKFHSERFVGYGVLLGLTITYSLLDAFYLGQIESKKGNSSPAWLKFEVNPQIARTEPNQYSSTGGNWNYGVSFETRF